MQDRISLYPGRVKLTPVSGQDNVYDMTRQDNPTTEGTPLNKSTLLTDEVAETLGLDPATATPSQAINAVAGKATDKKLSLTLAASCGHSGRRNGDTADAGRRHQRYLYRQQQRNIHRLRCGRKAHR